MSEFESIARAANAAWREHLQQREEKMSVTFRGLALQVEMFYAKNHIFYGKFSWLVEAAAYRPYLRAEDVTEQGLLFDQMEFNLNKDEALTFDEVEHMADLLAQELVKKQGAKALRRSERRAKLLAEIAWLDDEEAQGSAV